MDNKTKMLVLYDAIDITELSVNTQLQHKQDLFKWLGEFKDSFSDLNASERLSLVVRLEAQCIDLEYKILKSDSRDERWKMRGDLEHNKELIKAFKEVQ